MAAGLTIDHITLPFVGVGDLGPAQYPLTVLWFVALVNMINFTDGMDGLAAGSAASAPRPSRSWPPRSAAPTPRSWPPPSPAPASRFLVFNFHPARVFMGDSGSMLLGFVLAGVAISGVMKTTAAVAVVAPL